jgi:hypothetical protein
MKRLFGMAIFALCLVVLGSSAQTQLVPLTVSPGSEGAVAVVRQDCPTFSWTAVDWALGYRVAVFQAFGTEVPGYKGMAAMGAPLLSKEIPGRALSWTPSAEERLSSGSLYVWYVGALDSSGQGVWSEGKLFLVDAGGWTSGVADRVRKTLKEKGVSEKEINELFQETKSELQGEVKSGGEEAVSTWKILGDVKTQGTEGPTNTLYGYAAGAYTSGPYNTFMGAWAGYYNTTGTANTFQGYAAGYYNTTGTANTFQGYGAGLYNTVGTENTFLGYAAGYKNTSGFYNTFLGVSAGFSNNTGYENTFMGHQAGFANTTGRGNVFIGRRTGRNNTQGMWNTSVGFASGGGNILGNNNTIMGAQAGENKTAGSSNVFIGNNAGSGNTSGDGNIMIGVGASCGSTGSNNLIIGNGGGSASSLSNKLYIAHHQALQFPLIYGEFDNMILITGGRLGVNGRNPATNALEVLGNASKTTAGSWLANSDVRIKTDITEVEDAIGTVKKLHPVKFKYSSEWREKYPSIDDKTYYNFLAQEYQQVFPESVQGSGEYLDGDKDEILQLDSYNAQIVAIKAVQELILKNEEQEKLINQLLKEVDILKRIVN